MATYKGILTNNGKALIASATVNNKINYSHIAVGDGNGSVPDPSETRTALVNEKARIALNVVEINPNNTNQIMCEAIIPSNIGGFYIRELGLFAGPTMVVNANYPPTLKPLPDDGGAREINIKMVINIQNAEVIALYLDDSLIYATREWVNTNYIRRNELVDNLTTNDDTKPLSAKQGKVLQDTKQPNLGFIPIRQGTGSNQLNNIVHIGWLGDSLGVQVDGVGFNDVWPINIENNAGTANKLQTARTIGGVSFDGTLNINLPGVNVIGNQNTSGNAGTATKLQTARKINNVDFDGTGNITVTDDTKQPNLGFTPVRQGTGTGQKDNIVHIGWLGNSLGVQVDGVGFNDVWPINIRDNAGTATKLQTARNIALSGAVSGSANFDGSGNINIGVSLQVGLGVNQWWQNVTASRAINTSYYNGTGNPIMVNVGFDDTDSRNPTITIVVGGVTIIDQRYDGGGNYGVGQYCFIVPNGTYYSVNNTTVNSHKIWSELR